VFQASTLPAARYRIGLKPSPPVAVLTGRNGGSSAAPRFVPFWRAEGLPARTAVVALPLSVFWKVVPSVDHDGVHPGGAVAGVVDDPVDHIAVAGRAGARMGHVLRALLQDRGLGRGRGRAGHPDHRSGEEQAGGR
jgi:hypothetical protein